MKTKKIVIVLTLSLVFIFLIYKQQVLAASFQDITASIKISVCGDGVIEGEENCEGSNLNNKDCISLGYGAGNLSCDIACSFDVSQCSPLPTNTPTPFQTPTLTLSAAVTATPTPTRPDNSKDIQSQVVNIDREEVIKIWRRTILPNSLIIFDFDKNGKIDLYELFQATKSWVEEWRSMLLDENIEGMNCDLNADDICNLRDFSILLYYVERE